MALRLDRKVLAALADLMFAACALSGLYYRSLS